VFSSLPAAANQNHRRNPDGGGGGFLLEPQHNVTDGGDFANNPAAEQFIDKMVSKHGFDRQQLHEILSQAKRLDYVCA
jgi:membrane-bound lytic murein transglycosylase B